jgi:predicted ATPase
MSRLEISLLGPFRVTVDGNPVTRFEADTARALLAYLALCASRQAPCRRETLAGLLWPEQPEAEARHNLRQALSRVRKAIGDQDAEPPFLLVTRQTIQINSESDTWLDVSAFDGLIAACQGHHHRRLEACRSCMQRLGEAVELYRGDLLGGFSLNSAPFEEWLVAERERRHRQALDALHHLASYHERRGEHEQVQGYAQRQLALEPWREEAHRQLVRALALSGQRAAALVQYEACCQVLTEELGVEPEGETTALYERIRDGKLDDLARAPPHNLPVPVTPFVGREVEMAEIEECLGDPDCRLLTLVGPGGIGKTRLALEVAMTQVDAFEHGVFFVPLAPLQSADAIVPAVARVLGFSLSVDARADAPQELAQYVTARQQLLNYLRQRNLLLVLDNLEHLLTGVDVVTAILRTAQEVRILATSRERLNVQGEHLYPVAGVDYLDGVDATRTELLLSSAVRLFLHSARRVQPDLKATDENLAQVGQICRLVQGVPLAILLAAAWVGMLTPAEIATEIKQGIDILETSLRDVPERHRSVRAVFDHSWSLLAGREQEAFRGLSVFRGGFTRQAAQKVIGATLRDLTSLLHKSLLYRVSADRYDLAHELLRQYAVEKLEAAGRADEVRDAHSTYYAGLIPQREADLGGRRQLETLGATKADSENMLTAWTRALERKDYATIDRFLDGDDAVIDALLLGHPFVR